MCVIISFNCVPDEIATLCGVNDIVMLQEHWLTNDEMSLLSSMHPDIMGSGVSSVDTENG